MPTNGVGKSTLMNTSTKALLSWKKLKQNEREIKLDSEPTQGWTLTEKVRLVETQHSLVILF